MSLDSASAAGWTAGRPAVDFPSACPGGFHVTIVVEGPGLSALFGIGAGIPCSGEKFPAYSFPARRKKIPCSPAQAIVPQDPRIKGLFDADFAEKGRIPCKFAARREFFPARGPLPHLQEPLRLRHLHRHDLAHAALRRHRHAEQPVLRPLIVELRDGAASHGGAGRAARRGVEIGVRWLTPPKGRAYK